MQKAILAILVLLIGGLWWSGVLAPLSDPETIRAGVTAAGVWGPVLYIAIAMSLFFVFLLSPPVWASVALWPIPIAFVYSYIASVLASLLTYAVMRRFGREWARPRVPVGVRRWEAKLESRPFATILTMRFLLWANPLIDMLSAITDIPPRSYVVATLVGLLIPTACQIAIGVGGVAAVAVVPTWGWVAIALVAAAAGVAWKLVRRPDPAV